MRAQSNLGGTLMKCEFCERMFENLPYKRVIRGKPLVFCSEGCFNLHHYKYPKFDIDAMLRETHYPISGEVIEEAFKEAME
jgi:hypothetical protein